MGRTTLLIVEDDPAQRMIIQSILETEYSLEMVSSIEVAKERILTQSFDLFLLDIQLEDGNGMALCNFIRSLKSHRNTPIIFLTSKKDVSVKVEGFDSGADDYIVKPVDPQELRARISSRLRKFKNLSSHMMDSFQVGDLVFDLETQRITCQSKDLTSEMELTPLEFKLLVYMARNEGLALSRDDILRSVWGKATHVMDRSVDTYVASLRKKLGDRGPYIKSVHGVGYRFETPSSLNKEAA